MPDTDEVVLDYSRGLDLLPVNEGPVVTAEINECALPRFVTAQLGVFSRNEEVIQDEVVLRATADSDDRGRKGLGLRERA